MSTLFKGTINGKFTIDGEGLCIARDGGSGVTPEYPGTEPWAFTGGTIRRVRSTSAASPTSTSSARLRRC